MPKRILVLLVGSADAKETDAYQVLQIFRKAKVLGVDACPAYGRRLVDAGRLAASVTTPANTGEAIRALRKSWESGLPLALKAFTKPTPYPPTAGR